MKICALMCITVIFFSLCLNFGNGKDISKILLLIPVASKSLHNLFSSLAQSLSEEGHSVTMLSSFNQSTFHQNLIHLQPENVFSLQNLKYDYFQPMSILELRRWMQKGTTLVINSFWTNKLVKKLYKNRHRFDAIIIPSYVNDVLLPFFDGYGGVTIMVCTPGIEYTTISRYHNYLSLAVTPIVILPYDEYMTFLERVNNLIAFIALNADFTYNFLPKFLEDMQQYFPNFTNPDSFYERTSLTLVNGHFALDGPVPLLPNQVEIGTINAKKAQPLPKDLEEFVEGSGDAGVIYFSLGSFVLGKEIPKKAKETLIEAFSQIPQRVIWKYEESDLNLPPNVLTRKWLPQQDILGHPKTRVFISHCGNLGTQEAKYHGVPIVALPIAFDQHRNAARMARKGYAIVLNWHDMDAQSIVEAIHTITTDFNYSTRMSSLSRVLRDQKESPAERAVWWVEYVLRHRGAPHLRFAGQRLNMLQLYSVDVIAFLAALLAFITLVVMLTIKLCYRKICGRNTKAKTE